MADNNTASTSAFASASSAGASPNYAGLIGLGDTNRLDSSLYTECVDFDFFDAGPPSDPAPIVPAAISTTFDPETNSLLQLQIDPSTELGGGVLAVAAAAAADDPASFSTQLLLAALKDTQQTQSINDQPDDEPEPEPDSDPKATFHLFDLSSSSSSSSDSETGVDQELARINSGSNGNHWSAEEYYYLQYKQQLKRKQRKADGVGGGVGVVGSGHNKLGHGLRMLPGSDNDDVETSSDEEGYYLSDSERSDITDVTPMSSVGCSPMPPFCSTPNPGVLGEEFGGFEVDREESGEEPDGLEEDDDDIDEILRILPAEELEDEEELCGEQLGYGGGTGVPLAELGAGVGWEGARPKDSFLMSIGTSAAAAAGPPVEQPLGVDGGSAESASGRSSNSNSLLSLNYCSRNAPSTNFVEIQRRKMLVAHHHHHHHHSGHYQHHNLKLNKVHHHHHNSNNHHQGLYYHAHHHHHGHGHGRGAHGHSSSNYHAQYHALTMALARKRSTAQKQIEHDNTIMKRKLVAAKPSTDILKAFGPIPNPTSTATSSMLPKIQIAGGAKKKSSSSSSTVSTSSANSAATSSNYGN